MEISHEFPILPLMIIKTELGWSEAELHNVLLQYKFYFQKGLNGTDANKVLSDAHFAVPVCARQREQQLTTNLMLYIRRYLWLQTELHRLPGVFEKRAVIIDSRSLYDAGLVTGRMLIKQATSLASLIAQVKTQKMGTLLKCVAGLALESIHLILDHSEITQNEQKVELMSVYDEALMSHYQASILSTFSSMFFERERFVTLQLFSKTLNSFALPLVYNKLKHRILQVPILKSQVTLTKAETILQQAKKLAANVNSAELPIPLIDKFDLDSAQEYIKSTNETILFIKNASSPYQLVNEFKRTRHPLLLGHSGKASLELDLPSMRSCLIGTRLGQDLEQVFGSKSSKGLPACFQCTRIEQNSSALRVRFPNFTIPIHFHQYFMERIAPSLSAPKVIALLRLISELETGLQIYAMLIHEFYETSSFTLDSSVTLNPVKDTFEVAKKLHNISSELYYIGIHGRILSNHLITHSLSLMNKEMQLAQYECLVLPDGYSEKCGRLSSESFFERLCLQVFAALHVSTDTRQTALHEFAFLVIALHSYLILYDGADEREKENILCIVAFTSSHLSLHLKQSNYN